MSFELRDFVCYVCYVLSRLSRFSFCGIMIKEKPYKLLWKLDELLGDRDSFLLREIRLCSWNQIGNNGANECEMNDNFP